MQENFLKLDQLQPNYTEDASRKILFTGLGVIDSDGRAISKGYLAINGQTIAGSGPLADLLADPSTYGKAWQGFELVNATGYTIIPGLINAHTHSPMSFFRGLAHSQPEMIESFMFPMERNLTAAMIEPLSYSYLYDSLCSGVTSVVDHYYFAEGVAAAVDRFGMRGFIGETIADLGGAFSGRQRWLLALDWMQRWPHSSRVRPCIAPHAADTVSKDLMKELIAYAQKHDVPLHMHLSQTAGERQRVLQREGVSPVKFVADCGMNGVKNLVVHLVTADDADIQLLKQMGVTAVVCPSSQVIYETLAPITDMANQEVAVAIATDCAACNDSADMLAELKIAALFYKDRFYREGAPYSAKMPNSQQMLSMATQTPARALGMEGKIGTLKVGALADLVFIKKDLALLPELNPYENLIYTWSSRHVEHVMIDGRFRLWQRQPVGLDVTLMTTQFEEAVQAIHRLTGFKSSW